MGIDSKKLLEHAEKDPVKTWKEIKHASKALTSPKVRLHACYAARRFLLDSDEDLPLPESHLELPEPVKPPTYLTWDEAGKICDAASPPYNMVFRIMLTSGWGANEFLQFNKVQTWRAVKAKQGEEYFRYAFRGRKKNRRPFYSLVPMQVLKNCLALEAQKKIPLPLSHRGMNGESLSPLDDTHIITNRRYMESAFKTALNRAPVTLTQGSPSLHELRDTFLTRAIQVGCFDSAANFVMGHVIDRLGYNKCDRDESWLWSEIKKIHGPALVTEETYAKQALEIQKLREELNEIKRSDIEQEIESLQGEIEQGLPNQVAEGNMSEQEAKERQAYYQERLNRLREQLSKLTVGVA
jgi:integrase